MLKAQLSLVLASDETLMELAEVVNRTRFDCYLQRSVRQKQVREYMNACRKVHISFPISACRDPKDDKFLAVAVHGQADLIVTGDADLLALHPFRGISIRTPADYLELQWPVYPEDIMTSSATKPRRVAVYCGSANGTNPAFLDEARTLGTAIAAAGLGMVYGGANIGLMGAVADAALVGGAEVVGVLPEVLAGKEIAHTGLTRLELVPTMHQRKARMIALADAFMVLLDTAVTAGFLKQRNRELLRVAANAEEAVAMLIAH